MKWKGELIKREFDIMKGIYHPNIVQLHASYPDEKFYNFVLEYCPGGNLFELIKRYRKLSLETSLYYFCELLLALEYLHKRNIIFRDIKAENIMLDEKGHLKVTDFGLAKVLNHPDEIVNSFCGSPIYIAPETLKKEPYSRKVDFYAVGILLYEMITGLPPFLNKDPNMLRSLKLAGYVRYPSGMSPIVKNLLESLLHANPEKRVSDYDFYYRKLLELGVDHNHVRANYQTYIMDLDLYNTIGKRETGEATCSSFKELGDVALKKSYDSLENHIKFNRMKRHKGLESKIFGYSKAELCFGKRQLPAIVEESVETSMSSSIGGASHKIGRSTALKMPAVENSAVGVFGGHSSEVRGPFCDLSTAKKRINLRLFDSEYSESN